MKMFKYFSVCFLILALYGCTHRYNMDAPIVPVGLENQLKPEKDLFKGVTTQADRRLVLTAVDEGDKGKQLPVICAEPYPDGAAELMIWSKFKSARKDTILEKEKGYGRDVDLPFPMHPGVKFYRDGVFSLCQAAMNGWVSTDRNQRVKCYGDQVRIKALAGQASREVLAGIDSIPSAAGNLAKISNTISNTINKEISEEKLSEFECQLNQLREAAVSILTEESRAEKRKADQIQLKIEAQLQKACETDTMKKSHKTECEAFSKKLLLREVAKN